ncbi:MAG: SCO1664 family protein [Propionibacteriales bacterium]|nr:SCO1664 family protein [Propionibacteriales bacterium]
MTDESLRLLREGELAIEGRLLSASNATFVGRLSLDGAESACVYKPVRGERPLWDFPDGTLAGRERAAYLLSEASGAGLVPPTMLRDGPFGDGMCQLWIEEDTDRMLVDVVPEGKIPPGWRHILDAEDHRRRAVSLVHAEHDALRRMVVLDAIMNNADRKGGHVLVDHDGRVYGVDHGVSFHEEPKLRTVLWGWAGERLPESCVEVVRRVRRWLDSADADELGELLTKAEIDALHERAAAILRSDEFPLPRSDWRAIPWPAF